MSKNNVISDIRYSSDYRRGSVRKYEWREQLPYDWRSEGIIRKIAPAFLMNSNNPVLTQLMRFIDMQSITMMLFIDKIKNFKNYLVK